MRARDTDCAVIACDKNFKTCRRFSGEYFPSPRFEIIITTIIKKTKSRFHYITRT